MLRIYPQGLEDWRLLVKKKTPLFTDKKVSEKSVTHIHLTIICTVGTALNCSNSMTRSYIYCGNSMPKPRSIWVFFSLHCFLVIKTSLTWFKCALMCNVGVCKWCLSNTCCYTRVQLTMTHPLFTNVVIPPFVTSVLVKVTAVSPSSRWVTHRTHPAIGGA